MRYKEIEFKYDASDIKLSDFHDFCAAKKPTKMFSASGWDHFFGNDKEPDSFYRHRIGPDANQLTFKKKTVDHNNYTRTEHNLDLQGVSEHQVTAFVAENGYNYNFTIYKNCLVYKYDSYILVYYICYDKDMKEMGRFIEIEMAEDFPWLSEGEAYNALVAMERICKPIGIRPNARVKRSLFEMFKK